jgi:hypothetical protein
MALEININLNEADISTDADKELKTKTKNIHDRETSSSNSDTARVQRLLDGSVLHLGMDSIKSTGKQVLSTTIGNIGTRYGDVARMNKINNDLTRLNTGYNILSATIAGAVVGGPVGAAVGFLGSVLSEGYARNQRNIDYKLEQEENKLVQQRNLEQLGLLATDINR